MNPNKAFHCKPNPQTSADFPTLEQIWVKAISSVSPDLPADKQLSMKLMFLSGFSACLEINMDIGLLPSEQEAIKVMSSYVKEVNELSSACVQNLSQAMADSLAKIKADALDKVDPNDPV